MTPARSAALNNPEIRLWSRRGSTDSAGSWLLVSTRAVDGSIVSSRAWANWATQGTDPWHQVTDYSMASAASRAAIR